MKRIFIAFLIAILSVFFLTSQQVFAKPLSEITDEEITELALTIAKLGEAFADIMDNYKHMTPKDQAVFQKAWLKYWLELQKENPELKIEFK